MRQFDYRAGQALAQHGRPQPQYQQQQQYYPPQQFPGQYPQQQQPPRGPQFDMNQLVGAVNNNTKNIETMHQRVTILEQKLAEALHMKNNAGRVTDDFRSGNRDVADTILEYTDKRYGFDPKEAQQYDEVEVEEDDFEEEENMNTITPELVTKNPYNDKKELDISKEVFKADEKIKKIDCLVCTGGLSGMDVEEITKDLESNSFGSNAIVTYDYVNVTKKFITSELLVPAETVHHVIRRLIAEASDVNVCAYLKGMDRILTNKLNEYLELHVSKIEIPSYANDYEELCFIIRDRMGVDVYKDFITGFSQIVEDSVRRTFKYYFEKYELSDDDLIPLLDLNTVVKLDKLTDFLGIDIRSVKYDSFTQVIVDGEASRLFEMISRVCDSLNPGRRTYHLITREDYVFKLVHTSNNKLYIKRFISNM